MTDRSTHEQPQTGPRQPNATFIRPQPGDFGSNAPQQAVSGAQQGGQVTADFGEVTLRGILIDDLTRLSLKYASGTDEHATLKSAVHVMGADRQLHLDAQTAVIRMADCVRQRADERQKMAEVIDRLAKAHAEEAATLKGKIALARLALAD